MRFLFLSFPRVFGCVFCFCRMDELPPAPPPPVFSLPLCLPSRALSGLTFPLPPNPFARSAVPLHKSFQEFESLLPEPFPSSPNSMVPSGEGVLGSSFLAEYNGQKFKYDDLVDVIMGTAHGVVGKKSEPLKARFKGVVETERGPEFLCRPLVGSSRGRCPQYPRHSVFKICAFGACVLGSRETRYFSKLKPVMQERSTLEPHTILPNLICLSFLSFFIDSFSYFFLLILLLFFKGYA